MNIKDEILLEQIYSYNIDVTNKIESTCTLSEDIKLKIKEMSKILNVPMSNIIYTLINNFVSNQINNSLIISDVNSYDTALKSSNISVFIDADVYNRLKDISIKNNTTIKHIYSILINYIYEEKENICFIINSIIIPYAIYLYNYKKYVITFKKRKPLKDIKPIKKNNLNKNEYVNFDYAKKEINVISHYKTTNEDENIISYLQAKYKNNKISPIVRNLYVLFKNNYSPADLANIFNKTPRTFQLFFKENGLSRNRFEAQAIAKEKRDYKQILNKGRETMIKNQTLLKGSKQEVYTRDYINCRLPLEIIGSEIVVGINNKSILDNGKEIDIPIIILSNNKIYKFAIEYNGDFWHKNDEKDDIKLEMINQKGYHLFYIAPKHNATEKQVKEYIDYQVDHVIIPEIKKQIECKE